MTKRKPHYKFTVFCQEADGTGTIWIDTVFATDSDHAAVKGVAKCCGDWNGDPDEGEEPAYTADNVSAPGGGFLDMPLRSRHRVYAAAWYAHTQARHRAP